MVSTNRAGNAGAPLPGLVTLNPATLSGYSWQDWGATVTAQDANQTVQIQGNGWKKMPFAYNITATTVLEFDFRSDRQGEVHGIGFDNDDFATTNRSFQLYGTQSWGFNNYQNYSTAGEWQHYRIPVGEFFTGAMSYLTFIHDQDVWFPNANSLFRNIQVYENVAEPLEFTVGSFSGVKSFSNSVTQGGSSHLYRFTVNQTSDFNLVLEGLKTNADVKLLDAQGKVMQVGNRSGTTAELLYETLLPGQYSVQVESVEFQRTTGYDLILSAVPDEADTIHNLTVTSATYLGGLGQDKASAIEMAPTQELIVAGNFGSAQAGATGITARSLLGATSNSPGQIVRLSPSGREILSVTHLGNEINDMDVNRQTGTIAAVGDFGVAVLSADASQVLWTKNLGGPVERVAIANDGTVVTLNNKTVTVWSTNGQQIAQSTLVRSYVEDVAINPTTGAIYVTGFDNKRNVNNNNNPVQVAFLNRFDRNLNFQWQTWGYDGNTLTDGQNDMADTRGYRVTMGRDGELYFLGEVAGGNSIFRWNGQDRSTPTQVKYDAYNDPYNSGSPHQAYYARINQNTGEVLKGQLAFARLSNGKSNAFRVDEGTIAADEQGNIYIGGQGFSTIKDRDINQIGGETVGGYVKSDLTALVVSSDFQSRRLWTPFTQTTGTGMVQGFAVGSGRAALLGTVQQGSVITKSALNPNPFNANDGALGDIYLATWGTDTESGVAATVTGTANVDTLLGSRSMERFIGGQGGDRLTGNGGADAFFYGVASEGGDVITDFGADDRIEISAAGFGAGLVAGVGLSAFAYTATGVFTNGAIAYGNTATFLYNQGVLRFDPDGWGLQTAVTIATLTGAPTLLASQIAIV